MYPCESVMHMVHSMASHHRVASHSDGAAGGTGCGAQHGMVTGLLGTTYHLRSCSDLLLTGNE